MSAPNRPPKKRRFKLGQALIGVILMGVTVGLAIYLTSDSFRERVRARVVSELERMTGGKVELQSFSWNLSQLRFEARGLTIHGLEGPGEEPYVHADRISARLKITSMLGRKIALREVVTDHLTVHLIVGPDGSTNQPAPKSGPEESLSAQRLIDLAVGRVEVNGGTLVVNQERMPLDLAGEELSVGMSYSRREHGYDGNIALSLASVRWRDLAPISGRLELHFLLRATEAEIKSLKLTTARSTIEAGGTVRNYNHPEMRLKYNASLDLQEAARQARILGLRGGRADLKGEFIYRGGNYSSQGNLGVRGLEWRDASLHVSGVDAASPFSLTPEKLALPHIAARIFGGSVEGDAQVTDWNAPAVARKASPKRGTANLQFSHLEIRDMAAAISTARMPVERINAAGIGSGDIKVSWAGSPQKAVVAINLGVAPPDHPLPQQVPVTAQLRATYHGDLRILDVASLSLTTRAIHASGSGELGSRTAQARVTINATDLHEIQPVLDAFRPGTRIPVSVEGRAAFNGAVYGGLDALSARGHVELENFVTEIELSRIPHSGGTKPPSRMHWDSLAADLAYSPSSLALQRGVLRRGMEQVRFSVTAGLYQGHFDENLSRLTLDLRVDNAAVEDVQALAGLNYPVTGVLTADLRASGTVYSLAGSGSVQIAKLTLYVEPFQTFRSQLRLDREEVQLNNILLAHNGAQLTGSLVYDSGKGVFGFDLTGSNIVLATFRRLQSPRITLEGKVGFHLSGSTPAWVGAGGSGAPFIHGRVDVTGLALNHETVGTLNITADTRGEELMVSGRSAFADAVFNLDGSIRMRDEFPGQIKVQFSRLDFDSLLRAYLQNQVTGHSSIEGSIDIHGPMRRPRDLTVTGSVTQLSANLENVKVQNDGPIHFSMDHEVVRADQFHLVGQDTDLIIRGGVGIADDHTLDLHTRGRMNLKLAQGFNPNILAEGPVTFTVDVAGSAARPQMSGRLELGDANVSLADLPNGLSHITGSMVFAQDRVQIEKLTAQSGGGALNLGGLL